jgi:hypothetical protein
MHDHLPKGLPLSYRSSALRRGEGLRETLGPFTLFMCSRTEVVSAPHSR